MNGTSHAEIIDETSRWIVGGGIITMALFPLALPILALTVIAAIPLVLIALAGALSALEVAGGQIQAVNSVVNPEKLLHLGPVGDLGALLERPDL